MPKKPESRLTGLIQKTVQRELGGFWVKVHGGPFQMVGLPDLVGCCKGRFIGLEVKMPERAGTLTPIQAAIIRKINEAGGIAGMVTSPGEAIELINKNL